MLFVKCLEDETHDGNSTMIYRLLRCVFISAEMALKSVVLSQEGRKLPFVLYYIFCVQAAIFFALNFLKLLLL